MKAKCRVCGERVWRQWPSTKPVEEVLQNSLCTVCALPFRWPLNKEEKNRSGLLQHPCSPKHQDLANAEYVMRMKVTVWSTTSLTPEMQDSPSLLSCNPSHDKRPHITLVR